MKTVLTVSFAVLWAILLLGLTAADFQNTPFIRGDANQKNLVDMSDAVYILNYLYNGGPAPQCMDSADWNDDGRVDMSDAIGILNWIYTGEGHSGGFELSPDNTPDSLDCKSYSA